MRATTELLNRLKPPLKCIWTLLLLLSITSTPTASAEVFRWVDDNGKVHYGDKPADVISPDSERVRLYDNKADASPTSTGNTEVVLYSTRWCTYCDKAKALFEQRSISFTELDIETDRSAKREYDRLGGRGVPFITIGDKTINGYSEQRIHNALDYAGF